jgi:DNA ligase D-like protein (predicted 3'-phosphoesterase)
MSDNDRLERYRDKRDFRRSPEPRGKHGSRSRWSEDQNPIFVVQEHRASSHHFDFRLEADGVLKSWAVPKGPSTDPSEKRLARQVEDHPLDYADFEGTIPEDAYGGGAVIVWDAGPYRAIRKDDDDQPLPLSRQIEDGQVEVWLEGRKIRGGYALVRARVGGDDRNWLLVKMDDEGSDARRNPVSTERQSVLSGHTVDEVAQRDEDR